MKLLILITVSDVFGFNRKSFDTIVFVAFNELFDRKKNVPYSIKADTYLYSSQKLIKVKSFLVFMFMMDYDIKNMLTQTRQKKIL